MKKQYLIDQIRKKESFLCIGLDTDLTKIPKHLLNEVDPVFAFNKAVIDATNDLCVSYKPNLAFYESLGPKGWESLEKTMDYIPSEIFTIADAKRGDIGNTSKMYAKTFFEYFDFDAVTVAPYMGEDSVTPFLEFDDKWVILLALTSNLGSNDFQRLRANGKPLYEQIIKTAQRWGNPDNLMYVIGATHSHDIKAIRALAQDYFFLVPGIGAQGGDLEQTVTNGRNTDIGLLINSSRDIIYAGGDNENFAELVRAKALAVRDQMTTFIK
jgi:orotidine-5'-phosphate decarboxylase